MQANTKKRALKIGIWVEHPFQLYSAKPIFDKYIKRGDEVYLVTEIKEKKLCTKYLGLKDEQVLNINHFKKKWHSWFRLLFEIIFVPVDFSIVYYEEFVKKENSLLRFLRKMFFLKLKKNNVNKRFIDFKNLIYKLGFKTYFPVEFDLIISFTKVYNALMIPPNISHISIMESWDHPIKLPYFICPDFCLTWNKDLRDDTQRVQSIKRIMQIKPLKFRYISEKKNQSQEELMNSLKKPIYVDELNKMIKYKNEKKIVMYPTTTSSNGIEHNGEMSLIKDLCDAAQSSDFILYIKPKPNGPVGDYECFKNIENVMVGLYSSNPDARDMLDEEYHTFRYLLLEMCDTVINAGTTFVLEAALMDKKIVQLNLTGKKFGKFTDFINGYHLKNYILCNPFTFSYSDNSSLLRKGIENANMDFSSHIKPWITKWN